MRLRTMGRRLQSPAAVAVLALLFFCVVYLRLSTQYDTYAFKQPDILPVNIDSKRTVDGEQLSSRDDLRQQFAENRQTHILTKVSRPTHHEHAIPAVTATERRFEPAKPTGTSDPSKLSKISNAIVNAARHEDYESVLSYEDKTRVQIMLDNYSIDKRTKRIERLYSMNGAHDWRNFITSHDPDSLPPLTQFAQDYLYEHQNPDQCDEKQFLVMSRFPNDEDYGLGATVAAISMNLNIALRTGRILVYNTTNAPGEHFIQEPAADTSACGRRLDCVFEPLSRCQQHTRISDGNAMFLPASRELPSVYVETSPSSIPPVLGHAMKTLFPDSTPDFLKYWWRAQAMAYIMRINGPTMQKIKGLRADTIMHRGISVRHESGVVSNIVLPFPLPAGSFSMHIRHGDKGREMRLIPFNDYVQRAEQFVSENPLAYQKVAFISTEDDGVFEEAQRMVEESAQIMEKDLDAHARTTRNKEWTFFWNELPRINGGPEEQLQAFGDRTETTIRWLLQLMISLESDATIGTRNSFWSRLLDGLRCTWMANCKGAFLEAGDEQDWLFYGT